MGLRFWVEMLMGLWVEMLIFLGCQNMIPAPEEL
jgi:hypothetical protein